MEQHVQSAGETSGAARDPRQAGRDQDLSYEALRRELHTARSGAGGGEQRVVRIARCHRRRTPPADNGQQRANVAARSCRSHWHAIDADQDGGGRQGLRGGLPEHRVNC